MRELGELTDHDLRDLRFNRRDFREIAWAEARRRQRSLACARQPASEK
jgi:hypothetical protein